MRPSTRFLAAGLACSTTLTAAPFLAIGDNAELFLTADGSIRYESNVYLAPNNEDDAFAVEFSPGAELTFGRNSLVKGSVAAKYTFLEYLGEDIDDGLASLNGNVSYDNAKLKWTANATYREVYQTTRDFAGTPFLVRRNLGSAGVNGELRISEKSKVATGLSYSSTDYKANAFNDSDSWAVPVRFYYEVTPKVDASVGVRYRETQVDGLSPDRKDVYYSVGARGEFTSKLIGEFSIGYTHRELENGGGSSGMMGAEAGLTYLYSPKTQFTLDLTNDFDTGAAGSSKEVFSTSIGGVTQLDVNLRAGGSLMYQDVDYSNGRSDKFFMASAYGVYVINEYLTSTLSYSFQTNDSTVASFDAHTVSISASLRY